MFLSFAWMPKATVQAAIGGIVLDTARSVKGVSDADRALYIEYGNILLSTAVLAIVFTAPIGAILINTLGIKWLSHDGDEDDNQVNQSNDGLKPANSQVEKDDTQEFIKPANSINDIEVIKISRVTPQKDIKTNQIE